MGLVWILMDASSVRPKAVLYDDVDDVLVVRFSDEPFGWTEGLGAGRRSGRRPAARGAGAQRAGFAAPADAAARAGEGGLTMAHVVTIERAEAAPGVDYCEMRGLG